MSSLNIKQLEQEIQRIKGSPLYYLEQIMLYEKLVDILKLRIQQLEDKQTEPITWVR